MASYRVRPFLQLRGLIAILAAALATAPGCEDPAGPAADQDIGGFGGFPDVVVLTDTAGVDVPKDTKDGGTPDSTPSDSAGEVADTTATGDSVATGDSSGDAGDSKDTADVKTDTTTGNPCVPNPCSEPNKTLCSVTSGKALCNCVIGFDLQADGSCAPKCTPPASAPAPQKLLKKGDLVITEVMIWPLAVKDDAGEWFEIKNTTAKEINLNGLTITEDGGSDLHVINGCADKMKLQPGQTMALGRNGDKTKNGGNTYGYVYNSIT